MTLLSAVCLVLLLVMVKIQVILMQNFCLLKWIREYKSKFTGCLACYGREPDTQQPLLSFKDRQEIVMQIDLRIAKG